MQTAEKQTIECVIFQRDSFISNCFLKILLPNVTPPHPLNCQCLYHITPPSFVRNTLNSSLRRVGDIDQLSATLPFFFFFPPQTVIRCSETPGAKSCRLWTHTQSCVPSAACTGRGRQYLSTHIYFLFNRGHRGVTCSLWEEILSESAVQKGKK